MNRPGCYIPPGSECTERAPWAEDRGRSCMQASEPRWWQQLLKAEPGCKGCARATRAKTIYWKE